MISWLIWPGGADEPTLVQLKGAAIQRRLPARVCPWQDMYIDIAHPYGTCFDLDLGLQVSRGRDPVLFECALAWWGPHKHPGQPVIIIHPSRVNTGLVEERQRARVKRGREMETINCFLFCCQSTARRFRFEGSAAQRGSPHSFNDYQRALSLATLRRLQCLPAEEPTTN